MTLLGQFLRTGVNSVQYVHELIHSSHLSISWTRILGRRVLLIKSELDYDLARHSKDLSLASFASITLCKPIFGVSDDGVALLRQIDTRPIWAAEFLDANSAKAALDSALRYIETTFHTLPTESQTINFNAWLFHISAGATSHSLWGVDNPWLKSSGLMNDFYEFQQVFESLYLPLAPLTAPRAHSLRHTLLSKLRSFHAAHSTIRSDNIAHRLNIITSPSSTHQHHQKRNHQQQQQPWHTNPDYSTIELVTSLAILPTVGNITIWLLRHLFSHPALLAQVRSELTNLITTQSSTSTSTPTTSKPTLNLSQIRTSCPYLMASWYETLRLHMTGVAREATQGFTLAGGEEIEKGDILFLPMAQSNRDARVWDRPGEFWPERFVTRSVGGGDGEEKREKLAYALTRKVKGFGVAGNLCPGRYHSFGVIMGVVVSVMVMCEVEVVGKGGWEARKPVVAGGVSAGGFDRCGDEVEVVLRRKGGRGLALEWEGGMFRG
ncbi:cytochrome P450 [Podospora aff. communis PSN243]|uniref:Cytochrome P450 n=1 Tax=Podospora aff. communis PSN243 TaxID=3040156 RepID=A0AAV9GQB8_9PEZI|nr:cytochrome P450 [Podospora aff. communis PSN243]